jgi:hypothetical protein
VDKKNRFSIKGGKAQRVRKEKIDIMHPERDLHVMRVDKINKNGVWTRK